jgi:hypothetical protein
LIKGSAFSLVSGMAHDMPEEVIPLLVQQMTTHMNRVEAGTLATH